MVILLSKSYMIGCVWNKTIIKRRMKYHGNKIKRSYLRERVIVLIINGLKIMIISRMIMRIMIQH